MQRYLKAVALPLVMLASLACSLYPRAGATATPAAARPTPTVSPRPSPQATDVPAPAPTPVPSVAPPTPEPNPTLPPTALNATGPYVVFRTPAGIWLTNPDGSRPTQLTALSGQGDFRRAVSPAGDRLALVIVTDQGLDLVLVQIPGGETEIVAHLMAITRDEEIQDPLSPRAFATYAIRDYDNVAWQPGEGRYLAFIGASDGPTADLYVYDTQSGSITQLTDGPSQAVLPIWSPDGQFIVHAGVSWVPPFGGAIGGANQLDGVWAVRFADGQIVDLPRPKGFSPNFVGWQDQSHYLTYDSDEVCYSQNLRSVDVATGEATRITDLSFYYQAALSPEAGTLLFAGAAGCPTSPGEGVFLLPPGQSAPTRLQDKRAYEVEWLPESHVFLAYPEALFSADGQTRYDPPVYDASFEPAVSVDGYQAWEVIENRQGRVVVQAPGGHWQTVQNGLVSELIWDPVERNTLLIALEDGSLYSATAPEFVPTLVGNLGGSADQAIWLP